jgi:glycosyltransferase involved in cell wall biosynthesis
MRFAARKGAPLVLSVFPTFEVGGAQVRFARIVNHFGDALRHAVVAMDGRTGCAARLAPGIEVTFPRLSIRRASTLANMRSFRAALRAIAPDVLVTSNWGSIEWALAAQGLPLRHVHTEDGFGPEERDRQLFRRVLFRRLALRRAEVMVPSFTLWRIATEVWRLPQSRLHRIPNGIDLSRFAPRRGGARREERIVIGTVAALRPEKNLARLLRAVHALPAHLAARLVIVGDGPQRAALEALAGELGLSDRVLFAGAVEDPAPFYAGFDIFALSSDTEQMPLSVLEAMGAGLPVAATDVGDVRAMLAPSNAAHVVTGGHAELAGALQRLAEDPAQRAWIGAANRAVAERDFDEVQMFRAHAELLGLTREGAGASSPPPPLAAAAVMI